MPIAEIDDKVKTLLELIKQEGLDEKDGNGDGNLKRQPLIELIEDFHRNYQSLYDRYDNLTEILRKKIHGKPEKDTSSTSSSDSDSDHSTKERSDKNGKALSKNPETEEIIMHWKSEVERLDGEKTELLVENEDYKQKLNYARNLKVELNQRPKF